MLCILLMVVLRLATLLQYLGMQSGFEIGHIVAISWQAKHSVSFFSDSVHILTYPGKMCCGEHSICLMKTWPEQVSVFSGWNHGIDAQIILTVP